MQYRLLGEPATFTIDFKVDGEFVVPDESSVFLRVRDGQGLPYPQYDKVLLAGVSSTTTQVEIEASVQTGLDSFMTRILTVYFDYQGREYSVNIPYVVYSFVPLTVTEDNVRSLVGAEYREIPDSDIDIIGRYRILVQLHGSTFTDALRNDSISNRANLALAYFTALSLIPQLRSRLLSRERNDTSEFERFKVDFDKLEAMLIAQFQSEMAAVLDLSGVSGGSTDYSLMIVTTPTDPVTNT